MKKHVAATAVLAAFTLAAGWAGPASAEDAYPARVITIVNPFPAGGSLDNLGRLLAQRLSTTLKQPVVIENRMGAASAIGSQYVARAKPDGYTLLLQSRNFSTAPALDAPLPYHWKTDFTPVTLLGTIPQVLTVPADSPAKSVGDLVRMAKAKPGAVTYGTLGEGSGGHLTGVRFEQLAGVSLSQIPFKGSAQTLTALAGGYIDMAFGNLPEVMTYHQSGRVRLLAIGTESRSKLAPDLPTMAETGYPMLAEPWYGVLAPGGTPQPIVDRLQKEFADALKQPDIARRVQEMGIRVVASTPQNFARQIAEEVKTFTQMGKEANISLK